MRFGFNVSVDQGVIVVGRADQEDEPSASIGAWLFDEGVDITEEASEGVAINSR